MRLKHCLCFVLSAVALVSATVGCDKDESGSGTTGSTAQPQVTAPRPATQPIIPQVAMIDWCKEHGVPESVCTRCNDSLTAGFKAKNDWCQEHGLPDSQCFVHHPELQQKFAAAYKQKYGKEPPPLEPEEK